jgi:hypothetical protein
MLVIIFFLTDHLEESHYYFIFVFSDWTVSLGFDEC